jgi:uncharacterized protein YjaG (DUF416 family)
MSEGFHVHGAHDHAVEHGAQSGDKLSGRVAVTTAILSTVGALLSYQGGATQVAAMMYKNEAVLKKTEASNQWAYYQAKSNKQNLAELAQSMAPQEKVEFYKLEVDRYKQEKVDIKSKADALEEEVKKANDASEAAMHPHHRIAQALTLMQVAISLASITALTRKTWLYWAAMVSATGGAALWLSTLVAQ